MTWPCVLIQEEQQLQCAVEAHIHAHTTKLMMERKMTSPTSNPRVMRNTNRYRFGRVTVFVGSLLLCESRLCIWLAVV